MTVRVGQDCEQHICQVFESASAKAQLLLRLKKWHGLLRGCDWWPGFGMEVTVISTSPNKEKEARETLGADHFVVSKDEAQMSVGFSPTYRAILNCGLTACVDTVP